MTRRWCWQRHLTDRTQSFLQKSPRKWWVWENYTNPWQRCLATSQGKSNKPEENGTKCQEVSSEPWLWAGKSPQSVNTVPWPWPEPIPGSALDNSKGSPLAKALNLYTEQNLGETCKPKVKTSSNSEGHNTMLPAGTRKGAHLSSTCYLTFPHPKRTTQPLIWARQSRPRPAPSSCSPLGQPLHRLASPIPLTSPKRAAGGEIATPLPPRYPHDSNPHHNKRAFLIK